MLVGYVIYIMHLLQTYRVLMQLFLPSACSQDVMTRVAEELRNLTQSHILSLPKVNAEIVINSCILLIIRFNPYFEKFSLKEHCASAMIVK